MSIEVKNVSKKFGTFQALHNVNLKINSGELIALLGPSGSGKTTLLRIIAGLESPDSGQIYFDDRDVTFYPVQARGVGFVFQHYALFRHMTVFDNISFGLRVRPRNKRPSPTEIKERVQELLQLVQLEGLAGRYPSQLSGGQRQRVSLARALAVQPQVLLLDEPFGALDTKVRRELRRWLRRLHDELQITTIFVTHDQEETLELANRIVIMNHGQIEQEGTPEEVYDHPANPFVFDFLGSVNIFRGRVSHGKATLGAIEIHAPEYADRKDSPAVAYVRPHEWVIDRNKTDDTSMEVVIRYAHPVGPTIRLEVERLDEEEILEVELTKERFHELDLSVSQRIFIKPRNIRVFPI